MNERAAPSRQELRDEIVRFRAGFDSIMLATADDQGTPLASCAPCIIDAQGQVYIYVSGLSAHTANLLQSRRASLLFAAEASGGNAFARPRLTLDCEAQRIDRSDSTWEQILDEFGERFGAIVQTLRQLADFELFRLVPAAGNYVRGFGQAYRLRGAGLDDIEPQRPKPRAK